MSKKSYLINRNKLVNSVCQQADGGQELYRFFMMYHPVYEIEVNVEAEAVEDSYHIIEKYMDKLICGYTQEMERSTGEILIRDEVELFEFLGLNEDAYEIAQKFYTDLYEAGHFAITPKGLVPKDPAVRSVKLNKKVSEKTQLEQKYFDVFSMELLPSVFYEFEPYAVDASCLGKTENIEDAAILSEDTVGNRTMTDIENMIRNKHYSSIELIERGLPQGFKSLSVSAGADKRVAFLPYYLAVFRTQGGYAYKAYRIDNGAPIPWLEGMYASSCYQSARQRIHSLCEAAYSHTVKDPLTRTFTLTQDRMPVAQNGVLRNAAGNYVWTITEEQLRDVLGISNGGTPDYDACRQLVRYDVSCLSRFDAGRLVHIRMTPKQKALLADCLRAKDVDEIRTLYTAYSGG